MQVDNTHKKQHARLYHEKQLWGFKDAKFCKHSSVLTVKNDISGASSDALHQIFFQSVVDVDSLVSQTNILDLKQKCFVDP